MQLMQHLGQESVSIRQWLARGFAVAAVIGCFFFNATPALAQPMQPAGASAPVVFNSNMDTLYQALLDVANGDYVIYGNLAQPTPIITPPTAAIQTLINDLNGGLGPYMHVDEFLQRFIDATSGNTPWDIDYNPPGPDIDHPNADERIQNPTIPLNMLHMVLSGNLAPLTAMQFNVPYAYLVPCADPPCSPATGYIAPGADFPTPAQPVIGNGFQPTYGYLYTRPQSLMSFILAGTGNIGLATLKNAIMGETGAKAVLAVISSGTTDSGWPNATPPVPFPYHCSVTQLAYDRMYKIMTDLHGTSYQLDAYVANHYQSTPPNWTNDSQRKPQYFGDIIQRAIDNNSATLPGNATAAEIMDWLLTGYYGSPVDPNFAPLFANRFGVYTYYWNQSDHLGNNNGNPNYVLSPSHGTLGVLPPPGTVPDEDDVIKGCLNATASQWAFNIMQNNVGTFTPPTVPPPDPVNFTEIDMPDPEDSVNMPEVPVVASNGAQDPFIEDVPDVEIHPEDSALDDCNDNKEDDENHPLDDDATYAKDPCTWTRDNQNISFVKEHQAGWYFMDYLASWWETEYIPALKDMAAQLTSHIIDQTRQLGTAKDVGAMNKTAKTIQKKEVEARKTMEPSDGACVAGSFNSISATTNRASNALSNSLSQDVTNKGSGGPSQMVMPGSTTPTKRGKSAQLQERYSNYCSYVNDPDSNAGHDICDVTQDDLGARTGQVNVGDSVDTSQSDAKRSTLPDGDVDVEGFLFQDTIVLADKVNQTVAEMMIDNLVHPSADIQLDPSVATKTEGQEYILDREHVKILKKIASEVIASMISRRAAIPLPPVYIVTSNTNAYDNGGSGPPPPTGAPPGSPPQSTTTGATPGSSSSFDSYLAKIRQKEAGGNYGIRNGYNYLGGYQMGEEALIEAGYIQSIPTAKGQNQDGKAVVGQPMPPATISASMNPYIIQGKRMDSSCNCVRNFNVRVWDYTWKNGVGSNQNFLNTPAFQDDAYKKFLLRIWASIKSKGLDAYIGRTVGGQVLTASGLIGASHLVGTGGMRKYLTGTPTADAYGTTPAKYIKFFNGYDVSVITGNSYVPPDLPTVPVTGNDINTVSDPALDTPPADTKPVEVNASQMIRGIREKAGVPPEKINDAPSYNEVMQAMTKERFFDPEYFTKIEANLGAIKQEQASVNAYISVQMQDIYKMQEQINALLAARASIKLNTTYFPDHTDIMQFREE